MIFWRSKKRGRGGGWFALPKEVGGTAAKPTAMVRLAHPTERGKFYDASMAEWTTGKYTVWTAAEWQRKFGHTLADENRKWEHFGYHIPLYDDDDPNKVR